MKLSKIEKYKLNLPPIDFEERLSQIDYSNIDEEIRFYLKNFGIYNIKLKPDVYMLRLRIDGGRIDATKLLKVAQLAKDENLSIIITARAQLELHYIKPEKIYPIYMQIKSYGIKTYQTLTDNFRAIITDPLDEISNHSKVAIYPIITQIREYFLHKKEWMGLIPRKFNTAIIGTTNPRFNPWGNDLLMALAKKDNILGFNIYLGGKNSEVAKSANIFIPPNRATKMFIAVAKVYKEYGLRESRSKARLYHLIEEIGIAKVRELIAKFYQYPLESEGNLLVESSKVPSKLNDNIEIENGFYGEFDANRVIEIAQDAIDNNKTIRLSPEQSIYIIGSKQNSKSNLNITACAGARYCPLSLWDIKKDVELLPIDRLKELNISIGFSGCLKGCGRHYHSDIGLIGLRTNLYAQTERAARVYIGATESPNPSVAMLLFYSIPLRCLNEFLNILLDDFKESGYRYFEEFSINILKRYNLELLQLRYAITKDKNTPQIIKAFLNIDKELLRDSIYLLYDIEDNTPLVDAIKIVTHKSWDKR